MPTPAQEQQVLAYLRARGYNRAEQALRDELTGTNSSANVVSLAQLAHSERANVVESPQVYIRSYDALRSFVLGSLDIFRPELLPILLPSFVHSYLDLLDGNHRDEANTFLERFASDHETSNPSLVRLMRSAKLKEHAEQSEDLNRWRKDKFLIRLTDRGWSLLLGWLQTGSLRPSGDGVDDDSGRDRILRLINEHVKITIVSALALTAEPPGLESELGVGQVEPNTPELKLGVPPLDQKLDKEVKRVLKSVDQMESGSGQQEDGSSGATGAGESMATSTSGTGAGGDPDTTNADGSAPMAVDQKPGQEGAAAATVGDTTTTGAATEEAKPHSTAPTSSETLPYPPSFRVVDVRREVEKIREGRKRIRLGKDSFENVKDNEDAKDAALASSAPRESTKPSICLFTLHDTGGCLTATTLSEDSTLLAAGFSESYIRLWNLKGHNLRSFKSDFDPRTITDVQKLRKLREKGGSPTRKLIGHSGPVYSLSFDPVPGPAGPPRYMLSASQDGTVRLWSLDTYSTITIYRGHRSPVWAVEWGPKGIYFATGSRDRTARVWTTDSMNAVRIFAGHLSDVDCVKFHPNSLYLATGSSDRTCRIWDIQKGTCVRVLTGHRGPITCLEFSPNGRFLASGSEDSTVNLWDIGSGKCIRTLWGHSGRVESVAFGAESTIVASGGSDGSVRVWDADIERMLGESSSTTDSNGSIVNLDKNENTGSLMDAVAGPGGLRRSTGTGLPDGVATLESNKTSNDANLNNSINGTTSTDEASKSQWKGRNGEPSKEHLAAYFTKSTPVFDIRFTQRNLCLAIGPSCQE